MIKMIDGSEYENIYTVGDIHGEYTKLINQLNEVGFNFETDLLIGVGDLVDRGKESLKCSQLIHEPWFTTVMGNHEDFCIKGCNDYRTEFYHKMENNGGKWFYELDQSEKDLISKDFSELPIMIELNLNGKKYGFVHADLPYEDWELVKECLLNNDYIDGRSVKDYCLWARETVFKSHVEIAQIDQVFLGHTSLKRIVDVGNCKFIDSGAVYTGGALNIIKL